jgi:glutathione peroxidase
MSFKLRTKLFVAALAASLYGAPSVLDVVPLSIDGKPAPLAAYKGKVLLIVNVASHSVFTPQYEGLEWLYEIYRKQGLVVLAFPANNFGQEEPGANEDIRRFAVEKFKATFPVFAKISATGDDVAPLYELLTSKDANPATAGVVRWNFTKFLIGRDGKILARFEPDVEPKAPELVSAVEKALLGEAAPKPTEQVAAAQ